MKIVSIVAFTLLFSCGGGGENGSTEGIASDATRWLNSSLPINLRVSTSYSGFAQKNAIQDSTNEWTTAVENKVTFFPASLSNTSNKSYSDLSNYNDSEMGIYQLTSWPASLPSTALAVTQLFGYQNSNGGVVITHADILVNEDTYSFSTTAGDFTKYDFETVMLHELGHFLGLGHQSSSSNSVMVPSISLSDVNRTTTSLDRANMGYNYELSTSYTNSIMAGNSIAPVALHVGIQEGESEEEDLHPGVMEKLDFNLVRIQVYLMEDGQCITNVNGKNVDSHYVDLHPVRTIDSK